MDESIDQQVIELPYRPQSWNKFAFKGSRWQYVRYRDQIYRDIAYIIKAQKIKPMAGPVAVGFRYGFKTKRMSDIGDICTKPILDALVKFGIIEDDNRTVVCSVAHTWESAPEDFTKIMLTPHGTTRKK